MAKDIVVVVETNFRVFFDVEVLGKEFAIKVNNKSCVVHTPVNKNNKLCKIIVPTVKYSKLLRPYNGYILPLAVISRQISNK